jgi:phosphate transport system substrate-binding protein
VSPAHVIRLIEHSQVVYRIEHSAPVQAIVGTLLTTLVGLAVAAFFNRRRIAWRAYVDAPITLDAGLAKTMGSRVIHKVYVTDDGGGRLLHNGGAPTGPITPTGPAATAATAAATWPVATAEVEVPWLVLLRIRNSGRVTISGKEFNTPLTFTFPGREVRDVAVIDGAGDDPDKILIRPKISGARPAEPAGPPASGYRRLADRLRGRPAAVAPAPSPPRQAIDYIQLSDKFALNRRDRITIMAVLSGAPAVGSERITAQGKLIGGNIDVEPPRGGPGMRSVVSAGFILLLLVGLLLGLLLSPSPATQAASPCVGGQLTLTGSTAFAPVAAQIAKAYMAGCPAAHITVAADNSGSVNGLNTLNGAGPRSAGTLIAMSDGPAPADGYRALDGVPVAIITFEVVLNHGVGLYDLTTAQIKGIYDGAYINWRQLGGPDLPIRIISRDFGSGSRRAFDAYVLGGASEPSPTSFDCRSTSAPAAPVILCDAQSTGDLLSDVETIPGAIGYAQTGDVATAPAGTLQSVALNGLSGSFGNIGRLKINYQYWTTEYIYTYGHPAGLAAAFLGYLSNAVGLNDLADAGYTPCRDPDHPSAARLCAQAGS